MSEIPVVVVGGGPVGMGLAMNLEALGVRSMILNTEVKPRWHPKGGTQNCRTMEHYRRLGLSSRIRKLGLPKDHTTDVAYLTTLNGWEIARIPMPSEAEKQRAVAHADICDQVPEPILRCNQMYVEGFVFEHLRSLPRIDVRFGWECVDWEQRDDRIDVEILEVTSGRRERVQCQYLVGCDGGSSMVRRKLGTRYSGERPTERAYASGATLSTYLKAPSLYTQVIKNIAWHYWIINPAVRANLVTLDGQGSFLLNTKLNNPDEPPDETTIREQFRRAIGQEVDAEFIAHTPYTAGQALVADSYGSGRVLLAGDSVHLFTPTGGFGMNTGVDDAANLGWKLAATIQGWGGPRLIESYEAERRPIAFRNTGAAKAMSLTNGEVPVGSHITEDCAAGVSDRHAAAAVLNTFGNQFASLGVQLGARYDDSSIVFGDPQFRVEDDREEYVPTSQPGGRAPHAYLPGHISLFDQFGAGFTLLCLDATQDVSQMESAARERGIPLNTLRVGIPEIHKLYDCNLALIRPDQHVAWRGNRPPQDSMAVFARVTGW